MERSQHHAVLLVEVGLLLAAAACAAAESSCDTARLAGQLDSFCRPHEERYHHHHHNPAYCEAVRSAVETSLTVDPLCICRLVQEPAFIVSPLLSIRELPDIYVACGGRGNSRHVQHVADRCFAAAPPQQHGPVHVEAIYADDQPTLH